MTLSYIISLILLPELISNDSNLGRWTNDGPETPLISRRDLDEKEKGKGILLSRSSLSTTFIKLYYVGFPTYVMTTNLPPINHC